MEPTQTIHTGQFINNDGPGEEMAMKVPGHPDSFGVGPKAAIVALQDLSVCKAFMDVFKSLCPNDTKSPFTTVALGAEQAFVLLKAI